MARRGGKTKFGYLNLEVGGAVAREQGAIAGQLCDAPPGKTSV